jgi:hypothetical protein
MAKTGIGNFNLISETVVHGARTHLLPLGSASNHSIIVHNRTTLAYDVRITSRVQDPPRAVEFALPAKDQWVASYGALPGLRNTPDLLELLDPHGPPASQQVLSVVDFQYRLATGGVGVGAGGFWQSINASGIPLALSVDVI